MTPLETLQHHVTGAIERGESKAIEEVPASHSMLLSKVYEQLEAECLPLLEAYHADLTTHDRNSITQHDGVPFLHWTRNYGTHIMFMHHASHPIWPLQDWLKVPFIFGEAGRRHILRENASMGAYFAKECNRDQIKAVHYFSGKTLRKVTLEQAVTIANEWRDKTNEDWNKSNK